MTDSVLLCLLVVFVLFFFFFLAVLGFCCCMWAFYACLNLGLAVRASHCGAQALECAGSVVGCIDSVALPHVESSQTRDGTPRCGICGLFVDHMSHMKLFKTDDLSLAELI